MMKKLSFSDVMPLKKYAVFRSDTRQQILERKKIRRMHLTENATFYFEDYVTINYQLHEVLRIESITDKTEIENEIATYNPLIPDGTNWKATFMLEYPDVEVRRKSLAKLIGVATKTYIRIGKFESVFAFADEDLERETEEKTSSVHFLRFELTTEMLQHLAKKHTASNIYLGVDHSNLKHEQQIQEPLLTALLQDLDI